MGSAAVSIPSCWKGRKAPLPNRFLGLDAALSRSAQAVSHLLSLHRVVVFGSGNSHRLIAGAACANRRRKKN